MKHDPLYRRVRRILESARANVARSVNSTQIVANWMVGREIVEEEQQGHRRAGYGERLIEGLSRQLTKGYGKGFTVRNLEAFRAFYLEYPDLVSIPHAVRAEFGHGSDGLSRRSARSTQHSLVHPANLGKSPIGANLKSSRPESWRPGLLNPNLSWTHYRTLLRVDKLEARAFYEIETAKNNWSARELERQMGSLLYERLAMSRNRKGLLRLAEKGQEVQRATDVFKDPVVIEFLGMPAPARMVESSLEAALIDNLQAFLLELGKGFAFVARQARITIDGDHFYIDLVFYHTVLKCFVLVEIKMGKLTHADLGQLQFYVNYYDQERRTSGDGPTLGLILCTDKNDAVVKYTLGSKGERQIFASRYKLHLPTEVELTTEIRRELRALQRKNARP